MSAVRRAAAALGSAAVVLALAGASCRSAAARLEAPKPALELRLAEVAGLVVDEPVRALQWIDALASRYPEADAGELARLTAAALRTMEDRYRKAVSEGRWTDAAAAARSLNGLGAAGDRRTPADLALAGAKAAAAAGANLAAQLAAAASQAATPLAYADAAFFAGLAVSSGQAGNAAYFLAAADRAAAAAPEAVSDAAPAIDPAWRAFAAKAPTPDEMIKGVATVIVDRGIRFEKGLGYSDQIIGSAFFVDRTGYLVTNYHVVSSEVDPEYEGFSRLYIRMGGPGDPRQPARVVGWDPALDLALIKAETTPEFAFSVLSGAAAPIGAAVLAIGSPAGLEKTVTAGIVSARGRRFLEGGDVLQIDAAVNRGNSGGPVVDASGRLVGVAFAGIENFEGLNFAVPAERLCAALPRLLEGGRTERAWLGLHLAERNGGLEAVYVVPGSPAAERGFAEGDLIVAVDGQAAGAGLAALQDAMFRRRPGELATVDLADGRRRLVATAARPERPLASAVKADTPERLAAPLFGLRLSPSGSGPLQPAFIVREVLRGSAADDAGLSANDPVDLRGLAMDDEAGSAALTIFVKKRKLGYLETNMVLVASLLDPDTL